jgi:hypothetical protein
LQVCAKEAAASKFGAICLAALQRCLETFGDIDSSSLPQIDTQFHVISDGSGGGDSSNYGAVVRLVLQELMNNDPSMTVNRVSLLDFLALYDKNRFGIG